MKQFTAFVATLAFASGAVAHTLCTPKTARTIDQFYNPDQYTDLFNWVEKTQQPVTNVKAKRDTFECQGTDVCISYLQFVFCSNTDTNTLSFADGTTVNMDSGGFTKANGEIGNVKDATALGEAAPPPPLDAPKVPANSQPPINTETAVEMSTVEPTTTSSDESMATADESTATATADEPTATAEETATPQGSEGAAASRMVPAEWLWSLLALVGLLVV